MKNLPPIAPFTRSATQQPAPGDFHPRLILGIPTNGSQHKYSSHVLWAAQTQRKAMVG